MPKYYQGELVDRRMAVRCRHALIQKRIRLGLSQADVAASLGIDDSAVVRWEGGVREMRLSAFIAWCRTLGVCPAAVLKGAKREQ